VVPPADMNEAIRRIVDLQRPKAEQGGVALHWN
jgi:hypothetical protein